MKNKKKLKEKFKRKEQGITLIALVITIIVLLILAGVSIAMLTGENGILTQAQKAKEETENAQSNEANLLSGYEDYLYNATGDVRQVDDSNPGVLEGSGTEQDPFVINSIEDLVVFADNVTKGINLYQNQYVELGLSLDFNSDKSYVNPLRTDYGQYGYNGELKTLLTSGNGFITIGGTVIEETNNFYGIFDGNNNTIKNLYINISNEEEQNVGLFNRNRGVIKNLKLLDLNVEVKGKYYAVVGGITALNHNTVENCSVSGNIKGNHTDLGGAYVGGIVGINSEDTSNITLCSSNVNVQSKNEGEEPGEEGFLGANYGGGICANNYGLIQNCYNKGEIYVYSKFAEGAGGGICGRNKSLAQVSQCYDLGEISVIENTVLSLEKCGAIVGVNENNGIVENCIYNNIIEGIGTNEENGVITKVTKDETLNEEKILELIKE